MPGPIRLALVWHMHQPTYRDALTGRSLLPWARLHATKDYRDMAARLRRHPRVRVTFNLTPCLLEQLDALAEGGSDDYLDLARRAAASLTGEERRFVLSRFFSAHFEKMIAPHPPYLALYRRVEAVSGGPPSPESAHRIPTDALHDDALRDLQVWFHLAWVDPGYGSDEPIRSLLGKGSGFTEEEKGALLDWGVACAALVAGEYRAAAEAGQAELTTSAHHHPILPLLIDSDAPRAVSPGMSLPAPPFRAPMDAAEQLRRARESHARRFGAAPRGTWPPEGAVSPEALAAIAAAGFAWAASDEEVLGAALRAAGERAPWPAALHRPYRVETPAGPLGLVFRDRGLSDRIGFHYRAWSADAAAEDFLARVRAAGAGARETGTESPLVTVILDGENCWESYDQDGGPFLASLYRRLAEADDVETVTVSEGLERTGPPGVLPSVPVGSWIRSDLGIWVGQPEKNRAWSELRLARGAVEAARGSGTAPEAIAAAMEDIYAAEASDWFWWYGDDHPSAHRTELDRLFRAHLIRVYERLGRTAPASIRASLREDASGKPRGPAPRKLPRIRPRLDGPETGGAEWRDATRVAAGGESGTMHHASRRLHAIWAGTDGTDLWLRIDLEDLEAGPAGRERPESAVVHFRAEPGSAASSARIRLAGGAGAEGRAAEVHGVPEWTGGGADSREDPGEYRVARRIEARLPQGRIGPAPGGAIGMRVALEDRGETLESLPDSGWIEWELESPRHPSP
jgi:alpha-amylase/alpha-mannosidase (GH57 family)